MTFGQDCFRRISRNVARAETNTEPTTMKGNANGLFSKKFGTFIPKKLEIAVGMEMAIVMIVSDFITIFRLLEMIDAKASIMPLRMLL